MNTKRILVTGASGFIGSHTLEPLLNQNFEVHAVSHRRLLKSSKVHWHRCDLLDEQQRRMLLKQLKPAYLLHAAWYAEHGKFWSAPENNDWLNASKDLIREFADQGGQRIIGLGSCAEYDWKREDTKLWHEDDKCEPATLYGQAKHNTHQYLQAMAKSGLSYSWTRLFLTFGPHEPIAKLIPTVITSLLRGQRANCSSGQKYRDFSHVRDIGNCLSLLVESGHNGTVNLASGCGCSISEMTTLLAELLGRPDLLSLNRLQNISHEPLFMLPNISALRAAINYKFPPLKQRLEEDIEWWRVNLP